MKAQQDGCEDDMSRQICVWNDEIVSVSITAAANAKTSLLDQIDHDTFLTICKRHTGEQLFT